MNIAIKSSVLTTVLVLASIGVFMPGAATAAEWLGGGSSPSYSSWGYEGPSSSSWGYEPSVSSWGYEPSVSSWGYEPSTSSWGYEPSVSSWGYEPSMSSWGYEPSVSSWGYEPSTSSWGYEPSISSWGYEPSTSSWGYEDDYIPTWHYTGSVVEDTYTFPSYDMPVYSVSGGCVSCSSSSYPVMSTYYTPSVVFVPNMSSNSNSSAVSNATAVANASVINNVTTTQNTVQSSNPLAQPTCNIFANPTNVSHGGSSTFTWNSSNTTSATLSGFGAVAPNGSRLVSNITGTQTYVLTVTGLGGSNTCSTTVVVTQPQTPSCTVFANPSTVSSGGSTTVTWNSTNTTSATLTDIGSVSTSGSHTFHNIYGTRTFTVNVSGPGGSNSCSTTVTTQQIQPSCTINVSPSSINQGGNASLYWSSSNAISANITNIGSVGTSGSRTVSPSNSTTYAMTVYSNTGQTNTCATTLNVGTTQPGNLYCTLNASPSTIQNGAAATLMWNSYGGAISAVLSDGIGSVRTNGSLLVRPESSRSYTLTIYDTQGRSNTCTTHVNVLGSYVTLSQIPYTGFDGGPLYNTLYWLFIAGWAVGAGYLVVAYKGTIAGTFGNLAFAAGLASKPARGYGQVTIAEEAIRQADGTSNENEEENSSTNDAAVEQTMAKGDAMTLEDGSGSELPRISIVRRSL